MKTPRLRTSAALLAIVALLGTATGISSVTAATSKKTTKKAHASSSGLNRPAGTAVSAPLRKSKSSAKSGTPTKPKRRKKSKAINRGLFAADITTNGRTRTIKSPSAAVAVLRRAAAAKRRADKTGKTDDTFKAVVNLNDVRIAFRDPAAAEGACRELVKMLFRARKERIFLGDIGQIEAADMVAAKASPTTGTDSTSGASSKTNKKRQRALRKLKQQAAVQANARRLAAQREVQRRIKMKIQLEVLRNLGRPLNRFRVQQIVKAEIERAKKEGLIPADKKTTSGIGGTSLAEGGSREARIKAYRHELGRAFAQGKRLDAAN